jgi:phage pi2 protein 07
MLEKVKYSILKHHFIIIVMINLKKKTNYKFQIDKQLKLKPKIFPSVAICNEHWLFFTLITNSSSKFTRQIKFS